LSEEFRKLAFMAQARNRDSLNRHGALGRKHLTLNSYLEKQNAAAFVEFFLHFAGWGCSIESA